MNQHDGRNAAREESSVFLRTTAVPGERPVAVDLATNDLGPGVVLQVGRGQCEVRAPLTSDEARRLAVVLVQAANAVEDGGDFRATTVGQEPDIDTPLVLVDLAITDPTSAAEADEFEFDLSDYVDLVLVGVYARLTAEEVRRVAGVLIEAADAVKGP